MKRFLYVLLLLVPLTGLSQTGNVQFYIRNGEKPVPFANIYFPLYETGVNCDSSGFGLLNHIPYGKTQVEVSCIGYQTFSKEIEINEPEEVFYLPLTENQEFVKDVVITGTLRPVHKADCVVPVEVYTPEYFQKNPTPSLFEALQSVNGVRPQLQCNVCNTGDIHINGMEGPYTMVLIDGMPIVSGLSTVYGLSGIPNSIIQRVEIVKGPAASLYGSEAMGGIINVITKNPDNSARFFVDLSATSYQEINADFSAKAKIGKKVDVLVSGNHFHFNKKFDINQDNFTDVTLSQRSSFFTKMNFKRKENRTANIAFRYLNENRYGGELEWNNSFRGSDSIYGESILTNRWELLGNYALPLAKENIVINYSLNQHIQDSYYGDKAYFANQIIGFTQMVWDKKTGERNNFLAGIGQRYTYYDDNTVITGSDNGVNRPQKHALSGLFIQNETQISNKWKILGGVRYDYSNIHKHILSPRFSVKFKSGDFSTFRFSTGNGFRVVNVFSEDHAALTGGRNVVFAETLKPERSWNVNLNFTTLNVIEPAIVNLDASIFYTYYNNKIVADYLSNPEEIIYANLNGFAENYGASLSTDWNFVERLKINAGLTFIRSIIHTNGKQSPQLQTPFLTGNYAISLSLPKHKSSIDFTGYVNSPMLLPVFPNDFRPSKSPWFNISNLQFTNHSFKKITFYGGVKNLFNFFPKEQIIMRPFDPFDKNVNDPINNPFGYTFDPSYNYAPVQGIRGFAGIKFNIE